MLYFGDGKGSFPGPDLEVEGVQQPYGMDAADLNRRWKSGHGGRAVSQHTQGRAWSLIMLGDGAGGFTD